MKIRFSSIGFWGSYWDNPACQLVEKLVSQNLGRGSLLDADQPRQGPWGPIGAWGWNIKTTTAGTHPELIRNYITEKHSAVLWLLWGLQACPRSNAKWFISGNGKVVLLNPGTRKSWFGLWETSSLLWKISIFEYLWQVYQRAKWAMFNSHVKLPEAHDHDVPTSDVFLFPWPWLILCNIEH